MTTHEFFKSYLWIGVMLVIGLHTMYSVHRSEPKDFLTQMRGWLAGIGFVVLAVVLFFLRITNFFD